MLKCLAQALIGIVYPLLEPHDVCLDTLQHPACGQTQTIAFRDQHLYQLTVTGQRGLQFPCRWLGQRPHRGAYRERELRNHLGINPVGFGKPSRRFGKISHLT